MRVKPCRLPSRIRKSALRPDRVAVAPPLTAAADVTGRFELYHDAVRGPLGDSDALTDLSQADAGIVSDAEQHLSVVRQERPVDGGGVGHWINRRILNLDLEFTL